MKSVLIVYGTTEGQTRKIAEYIAHNLEDRGVQLDLVDSATASAALTQPVYVAAIACGSVHQHKFQGALVHFLLENKAWLNGIPTAFVSVSLAAAMKDEQSSAELTEVVEAFYRDTGWTPAITHHVAGALRYSQYDYFKRLIMKLIAKHQGGDTDTTCDHEYTDWSDLGRFVDEFVTATQIQPSGH